MLERRDLLKLGLASGAGLASGVWFRLPFPGPPAAGDGFPPAGRTLVLVELTGGNDGLNTFVPWADDRYHRARPALRIRPGDVHKVNDRMGYAPPLRRLAALHDDGHVAVVQGVGMPAPDRSHFTSLDRWHTGDPSSRPRGGGWLGRALETLPPQGASAFPGLALGDRALPRILQGTDRPVAACERLDALLPSPGVRRVLFSDALVRLDSLWGGPRDRELSRAARSLLSRLEGVLGDDRGPAGLSRGPLGTQLFDVLRLLRSDLHVPAMFVRIRGFDTHARQDRVHPALLAEIDASLPIFFRTLLKHGLAERTLTVVYSEFGRRVAENGSRGTDHGSAAPVFLLGGGVRPGVHGRAPDLRHLDAGDVRTTCDFRRVLAQALKHLGSPSPASLLGPEAVPLF